MIVETPVIRQRLFSAKTPEGSGLCLAFLMEGGCVILQDEQVVEIFGESQRALELALDHFLAIAKVTPER